MGKVWGGRSGREVTRCASGLGCSLLEAVKRDDWDDDWDDDNWVGGNGVSVSSW